MGTAMHALDARVTLDPCLRPASWHIRTYIQRSPQLETARREASAPQAEWSSLALLEMRWNLYGTKMLCKMRFRGA
jgi:hypothetical protein